MTARLGVLILALSVQFSSAGAAPPSVNRWVEGTKHNDGATRKYYNRAGTLRWKHGLGDWIDASGVEQGKDAYHRATWSNDGKRGPLRVEVTTLVREWLSGDHPNDGMFLRIAGGNGSFTVHSREHKKHPERRPRLLLTFNNGDTQTVTADADVHLDKSTFRGRGSKPVLLLSSRTNVLLHFELNDVAQGRRLKHAALALHSTKEAGRKLIVEVHRCATQRVSNSAPRLGIAARYRRDEGLDQDPDVYLFANFENGWKGQWTRIGRGSHVRNVSDDPREAFQTLDGKALRVKVAKGEHYGMNLKYKFAAETGREPEEIYFRYYLRFGKNWNPRSGGKLPGIAGTYDVAGWGGRVADGTNGWSARGQFNKVPPRSNSLAGRVPIGNYIYHADMKGPYGDIVLWTGRHKGFLERGRWYCIEQRVKMNTPGKKDGVLQAWVDGQLAFERKKMRWRKTPKLKIESIWMDVYHGGRAKASADAHLYIDNVVVAGRYIGPQKP